MMSNVEVVSLGAYNEDTLYQLCSHQTSPSTSPSTSFGGFSGWGITPCSSFDRKNGR